MPALTEH